MSVLGKLLKSVFVGPLLSAGAGLLGIGKKKAPAIAPPPIAARDVARDVAARDLELARRRGGAADIISGASGEPAAGSIGRLVVGS